MRRRKSRQRSFRAAKLFRPGFWVSRSIAAARDSSCCLMGMGAAATFAVLSNAAKIQAPII